MATPLDMGLLENFSGIFVFLLTLAATFGILELTKVFGDDKKGLNAIIAFCTAILLVMTTKPKIIITNMVPWFAMVGIFAMFLLIAMRFMFGGDAGNDMILRVMGGQGAGWWIFIIMGAIFLISFSAVIGPEVTPSGNTTTGTTLESGTASTNTGSWQTNVLNTLYHPKVLGTFMVLIIALASIKLLSTISPPPV